MKPRLTGIAAYPLLLLQPLLVLSFSVRVRSSLSASFLAFSASFSFMEDKVSSSVRAIAHYHHLCQYASVRYTFTILDNDKCVMVSVNPSITASVSVPVWQLWFQFHVVCHVTLTFYDPWKTTYSQIWNFMFVKRGLGWLSRYEIQSFELLDIRRYDVMITGVTGMCYRTCLQCPSES